MSWKISVTFDLESRNILDNLCIVKCRVCQKLKCLGFKLSNFGLNPRRVGEKNLTKNESVKIRQKAFPTDQVSVHTADIIKD